MARLSSCTECPHLLRHQDTLRSGKKDKHKSTVKPPDKIQFHRVRLAMPDAICNCSQTPKFWTLGQTAQILSSTPSPYAPAVLKGKSIPNLLRLNDVAENRPDLAFINILASVSSIAACLPDPLSGVHQVITRGGTHIGQSADGACCKATSVLSRTYATSACADSLINQSICNSWIAHILQKGSTAHNRVLPPATRGCAVQ